MAREVKFLRDRPERINLFGAFGFRADYPDLFDHLICRQLEEPRETLWNLELMAQLHFAKANYQGDRYVFVDEGLVHRGARYFRDEATFGRFDHYLHLLPPDFVLVNLAVPPELAIERATDRDRGLPQAMRGGSAADVAHRMQQTEAMINRACMIRRESGHPVIDLDGLRPLKENAEALWSELSALKPA